MESQPSTSKYSSKSFQTSLENTKALYEETKAMLRTAANPYETHQRQHADNSNIAQVQPNNPRKDVVVITRQVKKPLPPPSKKQKSCLNFSSRSRKIQLPIRIPALRSSACARSVAGGARRSGVSYISAGKATPLGHISQITTIADKNGIIQTNKIVSTIMQQNYAVYNPGTHLKPEKQVRNFVVPNPCADSMIELKWINTQQTYPQYGQSLLKPQGLPVTLLTPTYEEYVSANNGVQDYNNVLESLLVCKEIQTPENVNIQYQCDEVASIHKCNDDSRYSSKTEILKEYSHSNPESSNVDSNIKLYKQDDTKRKILTRLMNVYPNDSLVTQMVQCKLCFKLGRYRTLDNHYIVAHASKLEVKGTSPLLIDPHIVSYEVHEKVSSMSASQGPDAGQSPLTPSDMFWYGTPCEPDWMA